MPYEWTPDAEEPQSATLTAWPHQSLSRHGFVTFIVMTSLMLLVPLLALLGTMALWVLLPFLLLAVAAIWGALRLSQRNRSILETLHLERERITVEHQHQGHPAQRWEANPHWVTVEIHQHHRIENYLTLRGSGRTIELGSFLTSEERRDLFAELQSRLSDARGAEK